MTTSASAAVAHYAQRCIATVTGLVPVTSCAFYQVDAQLRPRHYLLHGMPGQVHQHYLSHYQQCDPLHPARFGHGTSVMPMGEAMAQGALRQSRYGRFMARHGMADVVELFVRRGGRVVAGFSLIRGEELGAFGNAELAMLQQLHGLLELAASGNLPLQLAAEAGLEEVALTPREREVALLLRDGASNKSIARLLDMGLPTVKTHLQHLYRKFGVNNRTGLASRLFLELAQGTEQGLAG